jgi:hypothetical protein
VSPRCPLFVVLTLAGPALAGGAFTDSNLAATPTAHAGGGGCYPLPLHLSALGIEQTNLINPEWAAVDVGSHAPPAADPVTIRGTVALSKINEGGDFSGNHLSDDQNTFLDLDPDDMRFVATGNVGEAGQLEVEWEIGDYPLFAWAGTGDHITTVGRWIWDCGHPEPDPLGSCSVTVSAACILDSDCALPGCPTCVPGETCTGVRFNYHSELHPPQAIAVSRLGQGWAFSRRPRPGKLATRTDVWISPEGGGAGDRCVVTHYPNPTDPPFTVECFPLSQPLADMNASDFAFDVPLPPRPPGATKPRVRVFDRTPPGLPRPPVTTSFVDASPPRVHAVVHMTAPVDGALPSRVGKTIVAGWKQDPTPVTRLRVVVTAIDILNPLKPVTPAAPERHRCSESAQDCSSAPCPGGETCLALGGPIPGWEVFLEVNGQWQRLEGLEDVTAPGSVPQALRYDVALPASTPLRIHASGRSLDCREASLYGVSLKRTLAVFGFTDGPACLQADSHDIGTLDLAFSSPDFGSCGRSRRHVTSSVGGAGGTCSTTTSQLCLGDADCPGGETCVVTGGSYKLHYTISKP